MRKRWRMLESVAPALSAVEGFPHLHPVATRLLANRGITDPFEAEAFLNPDWETGIHDPFLFSRMRKAVERVFEAIEIGERIAVHGDYDADGVTGSAIAIHALRDLASATGADPGLIEWYIPHRNTEGYGLHRDTVELLHDRGVTLIVTVDCGIASVEEIAAARRHHMDVIVLDHHSFGETLPDALLIHPRLPGEAYPFGHLAAVGVVWKFACALMAIARERGIAIPTGWEKWMLDLVSIATVTDMVPLTGENRVLLKYGLLVLNKTRREGLRRLVLAAGKEFGSLDSESIGFALGPRINAAGRMDHASIALKLLLSESLEDADARTAELEALNRARQSATERMLREAEGMLSEQSGQRCLAVWHPEWSPSLVGLVAGKLLDRTGKPCIAIGKSGEAWIGSGRSPAGYDIADAVRRAGDGILTRVGGHAQACGFAAAEEGNIRQLADRLRQDAAVRLTDDDVIPMIDVDADLALEDVDWRLVETLTAFEPFGVGNPRPLFLSRGLEVAESALVGSQGNHARCVLRSPGGRTQRFIAFKKGDRIAELAVGNRVDVVYDVGVNTWNGRTDIQCSITDFRPST